jgi:hypothetical protein
MIITQYKDQEKISMIMIHLRRRESVETLPNFIKRKHQIKREQKKQIARTKVQASKQPKRGMPHESKRTTK